MYFLLWKVILLLNLVLTVSVLFLSLSLYVIISRYELVDSLQTGAKSSRVHITALLSFGMLSPALHHSHPLNHIGARFDGGTILYDAASGRQLHNHHPVEEYDNQFSDSIKINGGYIVDSITDRTVCHLPPMISPSRYAVHETSLAVDTICGRVFVIHFPPALFTIPDTRAIEGDRMLQGR
ncbi:hypothetical protein PILCRDRAFT_15384 [Piloderma croceum F 1598]|uniref:Uncharacterized protein n=1 Tax=Piloderma croceum (strain F 1598) TaxID=765440 RepID=A0A0C3AHK0_PILCF|nr:hypothetical protein PILCRDRAFT_15384 [Piloderma croceum F 1598]